MKNSTRVSSIAMVATTVLALAGMVTPPRATAAEEVHPSKGDAVAQVTYYRALIRNKATQRCLASSVGGTAYTTPCNSTSPHQQWRFDRTDQQFIWNVGTGRCLYYVLGSGSATGLVSTKACNRSDYSQLWVAHVTGAEFTYYGRRCLDSNSAGTVYNLTCNGTGYQTWQKLYFSTP